MKPLTILVIVLFYLMQDYSPAQPFLLGDIANSNFDELNLDPTYELHDLRIDVLRQTEENQDADGNSTTEAVPYHPLGFDLGNGLFVDLHLNLSLRVDQLIGVTDLEKFEIREVRNIRMDQGVIHTVAAGEYCRRGQTKVITKPKNCYTWDLQKDLMSVRKKNRLLYTVEMSDNSLLHIPGSRNRKSGTKIVKESTGNYQVQRKKIMKQYTEKQGEINLQDKYVIKRSSDGEKLEIFRIKKKNRKEILQLTIEKQEGVLSIYNRKKKGKRVRVKTQEIEILKNQKVNRRYILVDK